MADQPTAPVVVPVATFAMPTRGHHSAPKFDGCPSYLKRFFDDIEQLAARTRITDTQCIEYALRYLEPEEEELWKTRAEARGNNWEEFKSGIVKLYSGAEDDRKYSVADLEWLMEKQAEVAIRNKADLGKYYRKFIQVAGFLLTHEHISQCEYNSAFMCRLNFKTHNEVWDRLKITLPQHHPDDSYPLKDAFDSASFIFAHTSGSSSVTTATPVTSSMAWVKSEPDDAIISIAKTISEQLQQIASLTQLIAASLA